MASRITILFDNDSSRSGLKYGWGFSALVQTPVTTLLFDTAHEYKALIHNYRSLFSSDEKVDRIFISHDHWDHVGGLCRELFSDKGITIHIPSTSQRLTSKIQRLGGTVDRVPTSDTSENPKGLHPICSGLYSTGEMEASPPEHSLVIDTPEGPAIICGCCHQGIVELVSYVGEAKGEPVSHVVGGLHLFRKSAVEIEKTVQQLKELGVQKLTATHCTGKKATAALREAFAENFIPAGSGAVIDLP